METKEALINAGLALPDHIIPDFTLTLPEHDERLHLALSRMTQMRKGELVRYTPRELATAIDHVQRDLALTLRVNPELLRRADPNAIEELLTFCEGDGGRVIVMRHGGQALNAVTSQLTGKEQKIAQMQSPHNEQDPLTSLSVAESCAPALALRYIAARIEKRVKVWSSQNRRAAQVGFLATHAANEFFVGDLRQNLLLYNTRLNCVNYQTPLREEQIALLGPDGSLPWEIKAVNAVCGRGTFEQVEIETINAINDGLAKGGIIVAVTHTQQTGVADVQMAGEEACRYTFLGFRAFDNHYSQLFLNGVHEG